MYWLKSLDTTSLKPANQDSKQVPKVVEPNNEITKL